MERRCGLKVV